MPSLARLHISEQGKGENRARWIAGGVMHFDGDWSANVLCVQSGHDVTAASWWNDQGRRRSRGTFTALGFFVQYEPTAAVVSDWKAGQENRASGHGTKIPRAILRNSDWLVRFDALSLPRMGLSQEPKTQRAGHSHGQQ